MMKDIIPNTIFQVWFKIDKELEDCEWAFKNQKSWKAYATENDFKYNLITDYNVDLYVPSNLKEFFYGLKTTFHKIDFIRYIVLNQEGGIYIDIDMEPDLENNLSDLLELNYIIGGWLNKKGLVEVSNSVVGGRPGQFESLIKYSMSEYKKKLNMKFYQCAKVRFFKQTCGVLMFKRWCRKNKLIHTPELNKYMSDQERCSWINIGLG